jgi:pimeloyl-ACP methyl ester carboxylesterase
VWVPRRKGDARDPRQIPDAEMLMVAGATHTAPIEQPELINRRVVDFLERRVDPAG